MEDLLELSRAVNSRSTDKLPTMKKTEINSGALKALENRINVMVDNIVAKIKEAVDKNEKKI
jgi:ribosome recycling factor